MEVERLDPKDPQLKCNNSRYQEEKIARHKESVQNLPKGKNMQGSIQENLNMDN